MLQREDIVLLGGAAVGTVLIATGHVNEGLIAYAAGMGGKAVIPQIAPAVVATPAAVAGKVVTVDGKNYVTQADGSLKPQ